MKLTEAELEELDLLMPETAARIRKEQAEEEAARLADDEEDPIVFVDQPVAPLVTESGEARDADTVLPDDVCAACLRGGVPRRGAPHTCGLPSPQFIPRQEHG